MTNNGWREPSTCCSSPKTSAASPQERQSAYARASSELDGLIVLPAPVRASIERRIAGQIEA